MRAFTELATSLGDAPRSEALDGLLAPYSDLFIAHDLVCVVLGSVARLRCDLASALGRIDDAVAWGEVAVEREAGAGLELALLSSRAGLAAALERRGRGEDRSRAKALRCEAESDTQRLGANPYPTDERSS